MIGNWHAIRAQGGTAEELLVSFDEERAMRVLILPALFDEANKLRRFTLDVMRALDLAGIDSFLPDLPGCNESLAPLVDQTLESWRGAAAAVSEEVSATHVLAIRAGTLVAPVTMPGWHYAAQTGPKLLRGMLRARTIAAREAGREESSEALLSLGRQEGLELAGWQLGAAMFRGLESAEPVQSEATETITQKELGGPGLWLRAEPGEAPDQARALAAIISAGSEETA